MPTEQQIISHYKLNEEQLINATNTIISVLQQDKQPSKNPIAVVVGGQPGAGKTALINFTKQLSSQRDFIIIDNDFFRNFHPQADEIKANYPNFFREITDQLGMEITSNVINYFAQNGFNIILHQTLKNGRVGDDAITNLRELGYTVGVRAFAVPFYESSMSQIERYLGQAQTLGYCRYATQEGHTTAYLGLPSTVDYLEQNGLYDFIQIYKRSQDISNPDLVYTKINPQTQDKTLQALKTCEKAPTCSQTNGFVDAKDAVLKTRYDEAIKLNQTIDTRIREAQNNPYNNPNIQARIDELNNTLTVIRASDNLDEQVSIVKSATQEETSAEVNNYINQMQQANCNLLQTVIVPQTVTPCEQSAPTAP